MKIKVWKTCIVTMKISSTNFKKFSKLLSVLILLFSLTYFIFSLRYTISSSSPISNSPPKKTRPFEEKTNLSHIVFGTASSANLWNHRKNYIKIWWRPDQMRGVVWLDKKIKKKASLIDQHLLPPIKISSGDVVIMNVKRKDRQIIKMTIRLSRIISETLNLGFDNVRWFVIGDDDTVFFPENLVEVLSKYDHNQFYYIGSSSESHTQNINLNYGMAFGGGGYAISYSLAKALEKFQESCTRRYPYTRFSDVRVHACLAELGVPLTKEPGFHQIDLTGNLLGLLLAHPLRPFLSLHHLDNVEPIFPNMDRFTALQKLQIPAKLDSAGLMQQSICYDETNSWTVSVSWGYAVQIICGIIPAREMEMPAQTFRNWDQTVDPKGFTFNTRQLSDNSCQVPFFYYLTNAVFDSEINQTISEYVRQPQAWKTKLKCKMVDPSEIDRIDVYKTPDPYLWDKAPRRNCCSVMPGKKKGTLKIDVGPCREDETINV